MAAVKKRLLIIFLLITSFATAQKRGDHLIGFRAGYNISGMDTRPDLKYKSISSADNYGVYYTYYHSLWGTINIFGFQTGVLKSTQGYKSDLGEDRFEAFTIPFVSQFHFDFWRMRFLINAGGFAGYRTSRVNYNGEGFDDSYNQIDYGFTAGTGFAFILKPFELHLEGNYLYSLSYYHSPKKFSETDYLFTYPKQLMLSLTLNIRL